MFRIPSINYGVNQNGPNIIIRYNPIFLQVAEKGFEVNSFPGALVGCPKSLHSSQAKTNENCLAEESFYRNVRPPLGKVVG